MAPRYTCPTGKIVYYDRKHADKNARKIEAKVSDPLIEWGSYECRECKRWHVTRTKNPYRGRL